MFSSMEVSDYYAAKDHFIVEDLFNFPHDDPGLDAASADNGVFDGVGGSLAETSAAGAGSGHGSSASGLGQHFPADFSQPCEEVAELEWLSNFVEDCFSNKDYHQNQNPLQFANMNLNSSSSSSSDQTPQLSADQLTTASTVPAKTRSKRSRANPGNWASRLPILSSTPAQLAPSSDSDAKANPKAVDLDDSVRRCLHCGSDKTPQWRMGPMGPKTLCNACGVRYKSGRLVPEYRPAASPTFVVSEHSNSHRKVVELRRQKEMQKQQQQQQQQMLFWS